ncbi:MAG: hypothetical protein AAGM22_33085 [Acidobacteriota bacterium]
MAAHPELQTLDSLQMAKLEDEPREALEEMRSSGQPWRVNLAGEHGVVVQDVNAYSEMLEIVERAEAIEGLRRGIESMERGEGRLASDVFADMRRRHKILSDD